METIVQIAAEITGCIDTAAEVCQIVTTDMAEAVPVLSFRVHLPLELSCGTASVGISTLLLYKVSWCCLITYCLMYFELILADLLLKQIIDACMSFSAASALVTMPSGRKAVVSKTSTDAFTKVL